ncbi:hypothetical protein [Fontivita pretiosa]|uniref:hypothetical protein n=1 Tax=Fontivita pretiosa TaxID=2989684 RepID=UPI003D177319
MMPEVEPPQLPPPPRPLTRRARRRSWAELPVRTWLILTVLVALVTVYFTATRISQARRDRWLIQHGTAVVATLGQTGGHLKPKRQLRTEPLPTTIIFTLNGKRYELVESLPPKEGAFAMEGMPFPIRVDPNDPTRWTEATEPKSWAQELTGLGVLVPVLVVLAGVTIWKRHGVLRSWRMAPLAAGIVVETRQSAMAPRSRIVRFTLRDGPDRRVWSMLVPTSAAIPEKGQTLWLLCPPGNPHRAVLARLYQE